MVKGLRVYSLNTLSITIDPVAQVIFLSLSVEYKTVATNLQNRIMFLGWLFSIESRDI
jgi:hypothetical protein